MAKYKVLDKKFITPKILGLTLAPINLEDEINFNPGQHATLSFENNRHKSPVRCFSIASAPSQTGVLEFGMRVGGKYTKAAANLQTNDQVNVEGPFGHFTLDPELDRSVTLIAGGIGITPFMSMIKEASLSPSSHRITLVYSVSTQQDAAYLDELRTMKEKNKSLQIIFAVSSGPTDRMRGFEGMVGRLNESGLQKFLNNQLKTDSFFLCGPALFMKSIKESLQNLNVDESMIITESFSQGSKNQSEKLLSWPANTYALTAVGILLALIVVSGVDIIETLPSKATSAAVANSYSSVEQVDGSVQSIPPIISQPQTNSTNQQSTTQTKTNSSAVPSSYNSSSSPTTKSSAQSSTVTPAPVTVPAPPPRTKAS